MLFKALMVFIFGLTVGSFLNAVIYRLGRKPTVFKGRSFCPHCGHKLKLLDLVPLFSFLFLKARCRYCKGGISWQYPLVEFGTGLLFVLVLIYSKSLFLWLFLTFLSSLLVIIFVYDLRFYLIPDSFLFIALFATFVYHGVEVFGLHSYNLSYFLKNFLLWGALTFFFFFLMWAISKGKWMGFGDAKLGFLIGLLLGFPQILVALFLSFFSGAIIGLSLILLGKKGIKSQIPFGPFLVFGTFVALFWGGEIIRWYLGFL